MKQASLIIESEISAGSLGGAFIKAQSLGSSPVAIIIPGSGPTDRDGNSALGIRASTYRLLAEGLAGQGISSIRIDKRGLFSSRNAIADANAVTIADYAADIAIWLDRARELAGAQHVWLIGHSEGGLVALATAAHRNDVAGLILLATPGRPLGEVMRAQLQANAANAPIRDEAMAAIDALEHRCRVDSTKLHPALQPLFRSEVQPYLIDAFTYDPAKLLSRVTKPVLVVQGTQDIQVSVEDARRLAAARSDVDLVLLPDVNHVLKTVPRDDRQANIAAYGDPGLPLGDAVVETIAVYIGESNRRQA